MRIGVLGTGMVGQTLSDRLVYLGHEVKMGSRQAGNEKAVAFAKRAGEKGSEGTFADAARFGEVVINATNGGASLDALTAAGAENLAGKVLIDVSNGLDFSHGAPPSLLVCNTDSLGEQIQRAFPDARVVKTLNTMTADVMVRPFLLDGPHTVFVCGNDASAKATVREILETFGWPSEDIMDIGDIAGSRATEMYVPLWLRLWNTTGTLYVNVKVVTGTP